MQLLELPHLALRSPPLVAVASIPQIQIGDFVGAARAVEARGDFVGDCLVVDESVGAGRVNGFVVEAHRIELAVFDAGELRANQRPAILESLGATLCPNLKLPVMCGKAVEHLVSLARR
jgi:hypothetical protein